MSRILWHDRSRAMTNKAGKHLFSVELPFMRLPWQSIMLRTCFPQQWFNHC